MNVVSLFSGAGGLDLGLEYAGFDTRICVEIDSDCRRTIALNRPDWNPSDHQGGDIRNITGDEILQIAGLEPGQVDVVAGGPPCQSFSNIGNRRGDRDARGQLVHHYLRIVGELQPRYFLFENVQGLLQHPNVIQILTAAFSDLGYAIRVALLNSADYGVPQIRKRLFILGGRGLKAPYLPKPTHCDPRVPAKGRKPWNTLRMALQSIPGDRYDAADNYVMQNAQYMKERMALIAPGSNFHALPMSMRPLCWKNGRHQGVDTFGRLELDKPSVTIRTSAYNPTKGRYIHPTEDRGLSTAEMAAIQTFPHDYYFFGKFGSVGRQIGNAVPPLLGCAIGSAIGDQMRGHLDFDTRLLEAADEPFLPNIEMLRTA